MPHGKSATLKRATVL